MGVTRIFAWGLASIFAMGLVTRMASAQEPPKEPPKFEFVKKEEVEAPEFKLSAQLGLLFTAGNSRSLTISGAATSSYKEEKNRVSGEVSGALARSNVLVAVDANNDGAIGPGEFSRQDTNAAKTVNGKIRYDRYLTDIDRIYASARAGFDEPAGKKIYYGGQVGYSRSLYKDEKNELVGELGYDLSHEAYVADNTSGITVHSARLFLGYVGKLYDPLTKTLRKAWCFVMVYSNLNKESIPQGEASIFEDTRGTFKLETTTKIIDKISLRAAVKVLFDNVPAPLPSFSIPFAPGFLPLAEKVDLITELAMVVNFL